MKKSIWDYLFLTSAGMVSNPFIWFILLAVLPLFITEGRSNNGHLEPASLYFLSAGLGMMCVSGIYNLLKK